MEPSGTSCTIDYWHGNFRNYHNYVIFLVIFAYMLPISIMYAPFMLTVTCIVYLVFRLFMFLRSVTQIQTKGATLR